ncbi:MAG: hypothetical protein H0W87_10070 [Actinobacteria bacterium]|nr:hypothetical protein [Actinomycetota bacterium]
MKRIVLGLAALSALVLTAPVFGSGAGLMSGSPSKWENIQVGITYRLYHPGNTLGNKLKKLKTISCGTGKEPWVAGTYGTSPRGFDIYEGHPICSDPGETTRVGNPTVMGVKGYLGVFCPPPKTCTVSQGFKNGFLLTWNAKPSKPYKKNTTIQINTSHLTLAQLMKVANGLKKVG